MEAYTGFAQVYDTFMDDTPYGEWCEYILELLHKHQTTNYDTNVIKIDTPKTDTPKTGDPKTDTPKTSTPNTNEISNDITSISAAPVPCTNQFDTNDNNVINDSVVKNDNNVTKTNYIPNNTAANMDTLYKNLQQERNSILDLGCGTGTLTQLLAKQGYDMIGIDNSQEMLLIAMDKRDDAGLEILYLLQDMRAFELYGTVGAVISVCDSVNYLLEEEDIVQTFTLVNNYLYPEGIFIFDFNTVYKYQTVIGDATIAENREKCSFIWDNYYHEEEEINEYDLTIFVQEDEEADIYRRFQETHYQRGYRLEQMKDCLLRAKMQFVEAVDADTHGAVTETSERIYVVARKGTITANTTIC